MNEKINTGTLEPSISAPSSATNRLSLMHVEFTVIRIIISRSSDERRVWCLFPWSFLVVPYQSFSGLFLLWTTKTASVMNIIKGLKSTLDSVGVDLVKGGRHRWTRVDFYELLSFLVSAFSFHRWIYVSKLPEKTFSEGGNNAFLWIK